MVRDLLAGHAETGRGGWPDQLRPALGSAAFAAELRDLMLRSAERGVDPARMATLGRRSGRPEWSAAAAFIREYQQVADLRQGSSGLGAALDQAELIGAALRLLDNDEILGTEQARMRHLFVDEYQDVDPAQAALIERLASAGARVGRGRRPRSVDLRLPRRGARRVDEVLRRRDGHAHHLATIRARHPGRRRSGRRVAPGRSRRSRPSRPAGGRPGSPIEVDLRVLPTAAGRPRYVADQLRRAHLLEGVPWSRMAVLVRSPRRADGAATGLRGGRGAGRRCPPTTGPRWRIRLPPRWSRSSNAGSIGSLVTGQRAWICSVRRSAGSTRWPCAGCAVRSGRPGPRADRVADQVAAILLGGPLPAELSDDLARPARALTRLLAIVAEARSAPTAESVLWDGLVGQRSGPGRWRSPPSAADRPASGPMRRWTRWSDCSTRPPISPPGCPAPGWPRSSPR